MGRKATFYLLNTLLVLFTAATLIAAIVCRCASGGVLAYGWQWMALLAPILFVLNTFLFIWWLIRRRWWVALMPLAALVVGFGSLALFVRLPHFGTTAEGDLRIATLNVHGFHQNKSRSYSVSRVAAMLRDEQIDVACMQEVLDDAEHPFDSLALSFTNRMPHYVREQAMACFSRYPILGHRYIPFSGSNQACLCVDMQVGKRKVRLISVHLQTSGISSASQRFQRDYNRKIPLDTLHNIMTENASIRAAQVRIVRAVIDTSAMPVLIAGDFNDLPVSQTYRMMNEGFTDAFPAAGHGWGGSYRNLLRIDYILYNDYFEATNSYVWRAEELSDHEPVIAWLRFAR